MFDPVVDILKEGDYESFELLLGKYIAPKSEYLFTACKGVQGANEDGKLKIVELLIEKGANVNHWLEDNVVSNSHHERICSFLIDPIRFGYKKLVDLLISKGITLTCDSMAVAIEKGDLGLVQLHRSSGVNYRYGSSKFFDNTSLALAYKNGSIDVAEYILNDEYDLGQDFDAINALICRNDRDKVELLLNLGTKVNYTRDRLDNSPIFIASTIGNFEIIKLLVEYGADCNIKDSNGKTVLHHLFQETYFRRYKHKLSQQEKIDIIDYFLNLGLDIDAVDNDGSTLLHCHCHGRDGTEILERLILRGAQINTPDRFGMTPLLQASKNGTIDAIKLLLRNGADLEARNCEGSNCYLVAIEGGNLDAVKFMRSYFDKNSRNSLGKGPFHLLKYAGSMEMFDYLFSEGVNMNNLDNSRNHALVTKNLYNYNNEDKEKRNYEYALLKYFSLEENRNYQNERGQTLENIAQSKYGPHVAKIVRSMREKAQQTWE